MARRSRTRRSNDEIFKDWQERFERIHTELTYVFANRRKYRDLQEMFQTNENLRRIGSQPYEWLTGHWGRDAVMAIRRELDGQSRTVSFGALLDDMAERNNVLTRKRFLAPMKSTDPYLIRVNNQLFDSYEIVSRTSRADEDYMSADGIEADRKSLNVAAAPVLKYANQLVAHRTPLKPLPLTVGEVNRAFDAIEAVFKKYFVMLTGSLLKLLNPRIWATTGETCLPFPGTRSPRLNRIKDHRPRGFDSRL